MKKKFKEWRKQKQISFYFTIKGKAKYCNRACKKWFFCIVFWKYLKTNESILIKKIEPIHGVLVYKKAIINEHRKDDILRDINYFVKMSVSTLVD